MRRKDEQQLDVFSYVSPEQRVPQDHPLRSLRAMTDEALRDLQPRFNKLYAKTGRPSIAPEKLLRALLLRAVLGAHRTTADGTARLQSAVPLVRGLEHGRRHLGCDRVHQEPRAPARWQHCRSLLPSRAPAGTRAESALGRALHRGWNVTGSVGECEELSAHPRRTRMRRWHAKARAKKRS